MDLRQKKIIDYALCFLKANLADEQSDVEDTGEDDELDADEKFVLSITEDELQQMIDELQFHIDTEESE